MDTFSYISNATPAYIENLYRDFVKDPSSVDQDWKKFFEGFDFAVREFGDQDISESTGGISPKEFQVLNMINAYRERGHLLSDTNPIRPRKDRKPNVDPEYFGLGEDDLQSEFYAGNVIGLGIATLEQIINQLRKYYCGSMGFEYAYIRDTEQRNWLKERIESGSGFANFDIDKKKRILSKLNETVVFENFLGKKYIGQKRFSLEGGESTIPALDAIINKSADHGVEETVIGMAHRGRLNVLVNILGKTYDQVFHEFEGNMPESPMGDGDVKYHLGFSSIVETTGGKEVYLKLAPNPSHLEAVNSVVEGYVRAKGDVLYGEDRKKVLPILIHGDAAIAGQGVVYEVIQMSKLKGYYTGGTIHFVINNQIGFTTDFDDARSSDYATGLAQVIHAPVIHVNGDDVEAVVFAAELAAEYRQKFQSDIFVDMVCYRKYGHNESDDPKYTQPVLYNLIGKHKNPRDIYVDQLTSSGDLEAELAKKMDKDFWQLLQDRFDMVKEKELPYVFQPPELAWRKLRLSKPEDFIKSPFTKVSKESIDHIADVINHVPEGFSPLRKTSKYLVQREELMSGNKKVDWAAAELLAYGSILMEGKDVRMSGQDVKRGTFSHRHAILYDVKTGEEHNRLEGLSEDQGQFRIYNSLLSEFAVTGFEFGYAMANPDALVIWEAQFGDFANGAQVAIDQFLSSSESKWNKMSGLVMLLPHGYEGQGPEHSSARMERFLQLSAEFNMAVVNITTPANFFHALRRQVIWPFRKPLIVMSPKSLLRHERCISPIGDLTKGGFKEIIDDPVTRKKAANVRRVLLCSGKIYYDLLEKQEEEKIDDVAVVRLEQLYPLAFDQLDKIVDQYKNAEFYWVQEEPSNMGAWSYMHSCYRKVDFKLVARKSSASPATGHPAVHMREQAAIVEESFAKENS